MCGVVRKKEKLDLIYRRMRHIYTQKEGYSLKGKSGERKREILEAVCWDKLGARIK